MRTLGRLPGQKNDRRQGILLSNALIYSVRSVGPKDGVELFRSVNSRGFDASTFIERGGLNAVFIAQTPDPVSAFPELHAVLMYYRALHIQLEILQPALSRADVIG